MRKLRAMLAESQKRYPGELATPNQVRLLADEYRKAAHLLHQICRAVYRQRNIIERMFCRLKDWRRIATRYDRNLKTFMSASPLPPPSSGGSNESGP